MKKKLNLILSLAVMILLIYFIFRDVSLTSVGLLLHNADYLTLLVAFLFYLSTYFLRINRLQILIDNKIKYGELFGITAIHNLFLNLLPARLGEISYVKMMHSRGVRLSSNIKSLIMMRVLDLAVILIFFIILFNYSFIKLNIWILILAIVVAFAILFFTFNLRYLSNLINFVITKLSRKFAWVEKRGEKIKGLFDGELNNYDKRTILKLLLFSFLIWASGFMLNYVLLIGLGIKINLFALLIIVTILLFCTMMPFYTPGGFGLIEGIWVGGLVFYGVTKEIAVTAGLYIHIAQLLMTIILALVGHLLLKFFYKRSTI